MSGVLFVLDVVSVVLIALWLWGVERPGGGWRVRLFDMDDQSGMKTGVQKGSWRSSLLDSRTKPRSADGTSPAEIRDGPPTWSSKQPRWRRGA